MYHYQRTVQTDNTQPLSFLIIIFLHHNCQTRILHQKAPIMLHCDCDWVVPDRLSHYTGPETELDCLCTGDTCYWSSDNKIRPYIYHYRRQDYKQTRHHCPPHLRDYQPGQHRDWPTGVDWSTERDWWFSNANFYKRNSIHIQDWRLTTSGNRDFHFQNLSSSHQHRWGSFNRHKKYFRGFITEWYATKDEKNDLPFPLSLAGPFLQLNLWSIIQQSSSLDHNLIRQLLGKSQSERHWSNVELKIHFWPELGPESCQSLARRLKLWHWGFSPVISTLLLPANNRRNKQFLKYESSLHQHQRLADRNVAIGPVLRLSLQSEEIWSS